MTPVDDANGKLLTLQLSILEEFGHTLDAHSKILDFGCNDGSLVRRCHEMGLKAYGVDVVLDRETEHLRRIPERGYRFPFADDTFDVVVSNSVFEHVSDLNVALSEMRRVLKPGGAGLHIFPSSARLIEGHIGVPFAGIFQNRLWLLMWAFLGMRNTYQHGTPYQRVAEQNGAFLTSQTSYRPWRRVKKQILAHFHRVRFAERQLIKHSYGRARMMFPLVSVCPPLARIYGTFHNRCVYFEGPRERPPSV